MEKKRYSIVYEDEHLMVIDKPSGMLVIPTPKKETNTLTDLLNRDLDLRGIEANAYPCHRLDRETSGLMVYAKGKSIQRLMMDEFKKRAVKKTYIAFAQGTVQGSFGTITRNIYDKNKGRSIPALTKYKVTERNRGFSVLEVEPVTGRTNQIRIHLKAIGHPIVGESVYAFRKDYKLRFKRVALHAKRLEFKHPMTRGRMVFDSPLPSDMRDFLLTINDKKVC
ncbi:MAG: RluA family pseudouridine synthase [Candidatus Omnitrophica bacterium]|nr:RluA family pseudouridine synthase [Candidatus Omnitrophota bacterium]